MAVRARFAMDFSDVVVEQGTMGQIVSQKGDLPLIVQWERIGDRPAVPSQLVPIVGPPAASTRDDDDDVFYPTMRRRGEVQNKEIEVVEDVAQVPVMSRASKEEDEARAANMASMEGNKASEAEKSQATKSQAAKGQGKGKGHRKGKGKKGKADVTV